MIKPIIIKLESGFTAVELLITLFIAAIFLFAGYQLYTQVLRDGTEANKNAQASMIAYDQLRKTVPSGNCTVSNGTPVSRTVSGFNNFKVTTNISCPQGLTLPLYKITVIASYKDGITPNAKEVVHATYVYGQ